MIYIDSTPVRDTPRDFIRITIVPRVRCSQYTHMLAH